MLERLTPPPGSRKASPFQESFIYPDEERVQKSRAAHMWRPSIGGTGLQYYWYNRYTRWSRRYNHIEECIAAMLKQGFGSYMDLDDKRVRLK